MPMLAIHLARASALSAAKKKSRPVRVLTTKAKGCARNCPSAATVTTTSSTQMTRLGLASCARVAAAAEAAAAAAVCAGRGGGGRVGFA